MARGGGGSINDASDALREQLDSQPTMDLDNLFATIESVKKSRDEKLKRDFDYQKEAYNLKATARNAGFDIDYDETTHQITPRNLPAPEPPRMKATRGVELNENDLVNYMDRFHLTRDQALRKLQGGMTTTTTDGTPPKPGSEQMKTVTDAGSDAVLSGFKQGLISKAKAENAPTKAKPMTESQRTAKGYQDKINRLVTKIKPLITTNDRLMSVTPKTFTTGQKVVGKLLPGKMGKGVYNAANRGEALRDYMQQLEAAIPFAKGGKALTKVEQDILFRLLDRGPNTSNESVMRNLEEFVTEYTNMGKLADGEPLTSEDQLSQLASEDISSMAGDVDSPESELQKLRQEYELE